MFIRAIGLWIPVHINFIEISNLDVAVPYISFFMDCCSAPPVTASLTASRKQSARVFLPARLRLRLLPLGADVVRRGGSDRRHVHRTQVVQLHRIRSRQRNRTSECRRRCCCHRGFRTLRLLGRQRRRRGGFSLSTTSGCWTRRRRESRRGR